jgi:hypothetical protein
MTKFVEKKNHLLTTAIAIYIYILFIYLFQFYDVASLANNIPRGILAMETGFFL